MGWGQLRKSVPTRSAFSTLRGCLTVLVQLKAFGYGFSNYLDILKDSYHKDVQIRIPPPDYRAWPVVAGSI